MKTSNLTSQEERAAKIAALVVNTCMAVSGLAFMAYVIFQASIRIF